MLAAYVGRDEPIVLTSPASGILPGSGDTRRYRNMADLQSGVANARVWAGVHFRHSTVAGAELGTKVGQWVVQKMLAPANAPPP